MQVKFIGIYEYLFLNNGAVCVAHAATKIRLRSLTRDNSCLCASNFYRIEVRGLLAIWQSVLGVVRRRNLAGSWKQRGWV